MARKIADAEMSQTGIVGKDTLLTSDFRDHDYETNESRAKLRNEIFNELITLKRPENDDDITKGFGGALPRTELKKDRQAYYIIGLPASGKSSVANNLSDKYGAIILDSDFAKRKFPEYNANFGASIVHKESGIVVFGGGSYSDENSILQYAVSQGYNIVIPKIGDCSKSVAEFSEKLKQLKYDVHLILVRLDRRKATLRALDRYAETERYVPLSLIFDEYSNNPTITFYDMMHLKRVFKSYTMISSDVPRNHKKELLISTKNSPVIDL